MPDPAQLLLPLHQPPRTPQPTQADPHRIHEVLKRCAKLANNCISQSLGHLSLFLDILESYLFFVVQKNIIEDKDEAISQLTQAVEEKLNETAETE